ncbi:uncharacterized protein N7459_002208 [Penicillium hispanicum]|uniref:uncharacterized protein n=1 Tax=Penicillium hispanicum TaxID=1080232 RepID=UPI002540817D|nr:uncharacterized protein N7459_002208 [Penicillium hispanicum]KAJ5591839.1 hypothetical protein N7459_002208 [Penicillium hispanicum]
MMPRTISLISSRNAEFQRAHFAIFVPAQADPNHGTLIQAIGAPMTGYVLEFKRNYSPADTTEPYTLIPIGDVDSHHIVDAITQEKRTDCTPVGNIELAASEVPTPGISENFLAPVNDNTNRRCQEWTMEYICHLVSKNLIDSDAIRIIQSKRDPPTHGVGLKAAVRR